MWYAVGLVFLALFIGLVMCTIGYRIARGEGWEAGYCEGRADLAQQVLLERRRVRSQSRAPRHAVTAPRTARAESSPLPPGMARNEAGHWYRTVARPQPAVTTARDLAPVFLPRPGTIIPVRPQPGRDSMDGTMVGGMGPLTDTGEFRAQLTARADAAIEAMQRAEAVYRAELTS